MLNENETEINDLNCFSQLNLNKNNKESIHIKIKEHRKSIKNIYENNKLFREIMPEIKKQSESKNLYNALIKNGLKYNSQIMRLIYRTISEINRKRIQRSAKEKKKKKNLYNLPKIEMLKSKKEKYENENMKKIRIIKLNKERLEEYKSKIRERIHLPLTTINESAKIKQSPKLFFHNLSSSKSTKNIDNIDKINLINNDLIHKNNSYISYNKDLTLTPTNISALIDNKTESPNISSTNITNNHNLKIFYPIFDSNNKNNNSFISLNQSKSMDILQKCDQEVKKGSRASISIIKYKKDFDKSIHQRINSQDLLDLDHKVLEQKKKFHDKYELMEAKNFKRIKRRIKEKISNHFAYENRKELGELLKVDNNAHAYNLHLLEVDKINQDILKRMGYERKIINKVKLMADSEFCRSIVINKKMDEINKKNKQIQKMNISDKVISPKKFLVPKVKNFGLNGSLVPSIIHIRKKEMKNSIRNKNKYLDKI